MVVHLAADRKGDALLQARLHLAQTVEARAPMLAQEL